MQPYTYLLRSRTMFSGIYSQESVYRIPYLDTILFSSLLLHPQYLYIFVIYSFIQVKLSFIYIS